MPRDMGGRPWYHVEAETPAHKHRAAGSGHPFKTFLLWDAVISIPFMVEVSRLSTTKRTREAETSPTPPVHRSLPHSG